MEVRYYISGRIEKTKRIISGWVVDLTSENTIVDLYVGNLLIASSSPRGERPDVIEYLSKKEIIPTVKDLQYHIDPADCPFVIVDEVIALLDKSIAEGTDIKDVISVQVRKSKTCLSFVNDISNTTLEDIRQLIFSSVRQISKHDPVWGACLLMRKGLEKNGLWCGPPLTDKEMDDHRNDPVSLCVDVEFLGIDAEGDGTYDALAYYRSMSHLYPIRPNALFDDHWYVRYYKAAHRAVASGLCRSGLDYYLHEGSNQGHLPACWMQNEFDNFSDIKTNVMQAITTSSALTSWLSEALVLDPVFDMKPAVFLSGLTDRRRSGVAYAATAPRHAASAWSKFLVKAGVFSNPAEAMMFQRRQDVLTRTEQVDFNGFIQGAARIVIFNTNHQTRNIHITRLMLEDAKCLLGPENVVYASQNNLVKTCQDNPDAVLLCIDGQRMNLSLISRARRHVVATVLWVFDDPYNLNSHLAAETHFDLIFTNDKGSAAAYGEKGFFLPLAASATSTVDGRQEKDYDIFFCGTAWPNRVVLLNRLLTDRPEYRYKLALTYNPHVPAVPLDRSRSSYVKTLSYDDYMSYARRSEITLALHRNFSGTDKLAISSSPGPRMFEVAASGSFQVSEDVSEDFKRIFNEDTVDYFADYDALLDSIDGALKNPASHHREKARVLRREVAARHTYAHRLGAILTEVQRLPLSPSHQQIAARTGRPKVLYVVHNTIKAEGYGGLEIHQDIIKENLSSDYDFYFFYTRPSDKGRDIVFADSKYNVLEVKNTSDKVLHNLIEHPHIEKFFSQVLSEYDFDGVHFFHFMNNAPSLAHIVRAANVPYVISVHDYYTACRQFNLTSYKGVYCDNTHTRIDDCDVCLKRQYGFRAGSQMERRDYFLEVLDNAASVIFVSDHTRDKFKELYPQLDYETKTRIHGAPIPNMNWAIRRMAQARQKVGVPKVLILGNFHPNKGGDYFIDAILTLPKLDLEFHFHGGVDERVKKTVLSVLGKRCTFHGKYRPGEIDLTQYDFSLHISNWPETYCQTLSEAWAARLVPIVTDIGALGTRVTHGVNGFKTDPNRPTTLARILRELSDRPDEFLALRDNITDDLFLTQDDQAGLYRKTYGEMFGPQITAPKDRAISSQSFTLVDLQRNRRNSSWNDPQVKHPPDEIVLPSMEYFAEAVAISHWDGKIQYLQRGNIDFLSTGDTMSTGLSQEIVVENDQIISVRGWVTPPAEAATAEPVVVILKSGQTIDPLVFNATVYDRPDLESYFRDKAARNWGLTSSLRLLNLKYFLSGKLDLYLGWRTPSTGTIYANEFPGKINMRYGG